ncbi:MAG: transposase [Chloroflexi bacterium]|nr:transposase [Chloroflexota bacterium]
MVFWDEFGFSFQEHLATTWARRGKRPIFRRVTKERRAVSTAVALTLSGKIYKKHFEGSVNSETLITALKHVQRHIPGKFILIWDRASIHTSKKTKAYLRNQPEIFVEELPPYAPQLNPEEYCHGNVKQHLKMLVLNAKKKFASCWIVALLAYAIDQIYCSDSFTMQNFLLGNLG